MEKVKDADILISIIKQHKILELTAAIQQRNWQIVWDGFTREYETGTFKDETEQHIFIDLFFHQCLCKICPVRQGQEFFTIIEKWYNFRKPQNRCGNLPQREKIGLIYFIIKVRNSLQEYLVHTDLTTATVITEGQGRALIALWRQVFFEPFSALALYWNPSQGEQQAMMEKWQKQGLGGLIAASMFQPFNADEYPVDIAKVIAPEIPACFKLIMIIWLVNTPYFHSTEKHRAKLLQNIPVICRVLQQHSEMVNTYFFFILVQEVMTALWRASYIGGNNLEALSAFGDFITFIMNKSIKLPAPQPVTKNLATGDKLRIGYISRNFYKQAVSCYMVNRVIYHNRDQFEVCVFALGDYHDEISELYQQNCAYFERITNLADLRAMAHKIMEQKLDILIYPDIGMDPVTYMLSGLQLAPVQCALVGHGTSTGMPTIQYYLSGDSEGPDAQQHYREKLIKLPHLGAAQYMAMKKKKYLSRKQIGIPQDAVVFISCANGLKHGKERYSVFIDILAQAPTAWLLLKPYAQPASIDYNFAEEIMAMAAEKGVAKRLKIMPPIADANQVLGLLSIADIQLDSFPYGGWTTNMEALHMGLPIITQEGEQGRSRWGAGMLRALGIEEGIAANAGEYVQWALRLAQDTALRQELSKKIKRRVKRVLFNGARAQPAYEKALIHLYEESCRKPSSQPLSDHAERPVIVTSLTAANLQLQLSAMQTWRQAGFHIVSMNAMDEMAALRPHAADIEFVAAERDARDTYGRPYIYLNDIMAYFKQRSIPYCGIVNSDIFLRRASLASFIQQECKNSFIFGSRLEVPTADAASGQEYTQGFDYFFFDRDLLALYPEGQEFCLGLPWWDYWIALVPLMHNRTVKKVVTPAVTHVMHATNWNLDTWVTMGTALARQFKPPFSLTTESMHKYAKETLTIIHSLSQKVTL